MKKRNQKGELTVLTIVALLAMTGMFTAAVEHGRYAQEKVVEVNE